MPPLTKYLWGGGIIYKFFTKGDKMTEEQKSKCHAIIHTHAVAAAAGNAVPVPGLGIAVDIATMTTMTLALAAVFKSDSLTEAAAKAVAIQAIKQTALKQPIKTITKEVSKLIPIPGSVIGAGIAAGFLETAGWWVADTFDEESKKKLK